LRPGPGGNGRAVFRKGRAVPAEAIVCHVPGTAVIVNGADNQPGGAKGLALGVNGLCRRGVNSDRGNDRARVVDRNAKAGALASIGNGNGFCPGCGGNGRAVFRKGRAVPTEGVVRYIDGTAVVVGAADDQPGGTKGLVLGVDGFCGRGVNADTDQARLAGG
jgi:hypothetical protein